MPIELGRSVARALVASAVGWPIVFLQLNAQGSSSPLGEGPLGVLVIAAAFLALVAGFSADARAGPIVAVAGVAGLRLLVGPIAAWVARAHAADSWTTRLALGLPDIGAFPCWTTNPDLADCSPYVRDQLCSWAGFGLPLIAVLVLLLHARPTPQRPWALAGPLVVALWTWGVVGGIPNGGATPPHQTPTGVVVAVALAGLFGLASRRLGRAVPALVGPALLLGIAGAECWPQHGLLYGLLYAPLGALSALLVGDARMIARGASVHAAP